jgi:hypothetical protein
VGERSGGDRIRAVDGRTLSAEELSRDVEGLAANNNDLLAVQELLGDSAGQATEQVTLSVNDDLYTPFMSAIALMTGVPCVQMRMRLFFRRRKFGPRSFSFSAHSVDGWMDLTYDRREFRHRCWSVMLVIVERSRAVREIHGFSVGFEMEGALSWQCGTLRDCRSWSDALASFVSSPSPHTSRSTLSLLHVHMFIYPSPHIV